MSHSKIPEEGAATPGTIQEFASQLLVGGSICTERLSQGADVMHDDRVLRVVGQEADFGAHVHCTGEDTICIHAESSFRQVALPQHSRETPKANVRCSEPDAQNALPHVLLDAQSHGAANGVSNTLPLSFPQARHHARKLVGGRPFHTGRRPATHGLQNAVKLGQWRRTEVRELLRVAWASGTGLIGLVS